MFICLSRQVLCLALFCAVCVIQIPPAFAARPGQASPSKSGTSADAPAWRINRLAAIQQKWSEVVNSIEAKDLKMASTRVNQLSSLRLEAGFNAFESYSEWLLGAGLRCIQSAEFEEAQAYLRMAFELSPASPRVIMRALPLVEALEGQGVAARKLREALLLIPGYPSIWLRLIKISLYPVLWAVTIGLYIAVGGYILWHFSEIMGRAAVVFPHAARGFLTPPLTLLALCLPTALGPVWCVSAWSCILLLSVPKQTWLPFLVGLTLLAWGGAVSLRENLEVRLKNPAMQAVLRIREGVFDRGDKGRLVKLLRKEPGQGLFWFEYGVQLRRQGAYSHAEKAFVEAEKFLGPQPWTAAERASLAFLRGDYEQADRFFEEAAAAGADSAAFWVNYSKVKFQMRDSEASAAYLAKAERLDPDLTSRYRAHEERFGLRSHASLAETGLPWRFALEAAISGSEDLRYIHEGTSHVLIRGFTPRMLFGMGALLAALSFLVRRRKSSVTVKAYYRQAAPSGIAFCILHLLPGGGWVVADRAGAAAAALALSSLLLMPIIEWPAESKYLLEAVPQLVTWYLAAAVVIVMLIYFLSSQNFEET